MLLCLLSRGPCADPDQRVRLEEHLATLCVLIKELYRKELAEEDLRMLSDSPVYGDISFYVETKKKREDTTYSTDRLSDKKEVEKLRIQAVTFDNKIEGLVRES